MHILSLLLLLASPLDGPQPNIPFVPVTPDSYQVDVIKKIGVAKQLVAKESVRVKWCNENVEGQKRVGRKIKKIIKVVRVECGREQALALLNVKTGVIKTVRVGAMKRDEIKTVKGFTIMRLSENGVNSEYVVTNDYDWVTAALKTMVSVQGRENKFTSAVYVPYSARLNIAATREAGMRHLLKIINDGYALLEKRHVHSLIAGIMEVDTQPLVTAIIPKETILTLDLIEHMDINEFQKCGAEKMIAKVLATVGLNESDAYRYAISEIKRHTPQGIKKLPGARGLAQFIKTTYTDIAELYPAARLKVDFGKGMDDHLNATMAQVCLADRDLAKLLNVNGPPADFDSLDLVNLYIAAAYNGGPGNAIHSCLCNKDQRWKDGSGLPPQTVIYVNEFRAVYKYLFPNDRLN